MICWGFYLQKGGQFLVQPENYREERSGSRGVQCDKTLSSRCKVVWCRKAESGSNSIGWFFLAGKLDILFEEKVLHNPRPTSDLCLKGRVSLFFSILPLVPLDIRAYCHEATFSKTLAWVFFWCLFMYRNGTKNLKNFGRHFHDWKLVWNFGLF